MSEPTYYAYKEGNDIYHYTQWGDGRNAVADPSNVEREFFIFHGHGGLKIDIKIGLWVPESSVGFSQMINMNRINFEGDVGFGWELPLSPELGLRNPLEPPDLPIGGGGQSPYSLEGLVVKLYRPHEDQPIHTWDFNRQDGRGSRELSYPISTINGNTVFVSPETMKKYGWWRCVVSHKAYSAHVVFWSKSYLQSAVPKETLLDYRWLNHAFTTLLGAITPRANIYDGKILIGIAEEVAHAVGQDGFTYEKTIDEIDHARFDLGPISVTAINGAMFKSYLTNELVRITEEGLSSVQEYVHVTTNFSRAEQEVKDDDVIIKILATFNNPYLTFSKAIVSGEILFDTKNQPHIFINLSPSKFKTYVNLHCKVTDLRAIEWKLIKWFAREQYDLLRDINEAVSLTIMKNIDLIEKFFRMGLARAVAQHAFIESFRASVNGWHITFCEHRKPDPANRAQVDQPGEATHNVNVTRGRNTRGSSGQPVRENIEIESTPVNLELGIIPQDFKVTDGAALERLDKLKAIVVIMMENRSFDHFLGNMCREIPLTNGDNYRGFPLDFSNPRKGNLVSPIKVRMASEQGFRNHLVTPISPEHEFEHVLKQISDGEGTETELQNMGLMQGFTIDLMNRLENYPPNMVDPQMAMCYYGRRELPMYYFLAENFKVLDHWFCSHPGPTWPNRIAMVTGKLIEKKNFDMRDSRLGFFKEPTIFETLTDYGIDWRYLESNVCILRLFDKYRTDIKKLVPLQENDLYTLTENNIKDDPLSGLELLLRQDTLPRVLFIDPRFSDVPPISRANDDLAPANIENGQTFIRDIYNKLFNSRHKNDIALVITYDEHGGFFDHVPPPGTQPSGIPAVDQIHPTGPSFLGVRVPAFLICPYVDGHTVSHAIFDHTSIMKTILVHNRHSIPKDVFSQFSARLRNAEHLGIALDRDTPKEMAAAPEQLYQDPTPPIVSMEEEIAYREAAGLNVYDYVESLRRLFLPK